MLARMAPRGPDACGEYDVPGTQLRLGHLRLSILDLEVRSNQPFTSACGRYALTFNGEIYNFLELRLALAAEGVHFTTTSDTEVLLELLIRNGAKALDMLDGMFAFAFVDSQERTLLLARDPIGEKPLYYSLGSATRPYTFAFASEIKGLLAVDGVDTSLDQEALRDYLRFLYTAAPRTLYRGIRELAPGHLLEIHLDAPVDRQRAWYDLEQRASAPFEGSYADAVAELREVTIQSLRLRLRSDVPVGFYLSGGMDSNILLGLARSAAPEQALDTYTIRYTGSELARSSDESVLAARGAAYRRAQNLAVDFRQDEGLIEAAERMNALFDQPFGNTTAIVSDQLAKIAALRHKVCVVGDGGDELAAGYPRYRALMMHGRASRVAAPLRFVVHGATALLGEHGRYATVLRRARMFADGVGRPMDECFLDWSTYATEADVTLALGKGSGPTAFSHAMGDLFRRNASDPLRAAALVDFRSFVPFNLMQSADRTAMAHSLELRSPYLSTRLVELSLRFPHGHKLRGSRAKPLFQDAFKSELPPFLARQRKKPFNPPMRTHVRAQLDSIEACLLGHGANLRELVSSDYLRRELEAFRSGRKENSTLLYGLVALERWLARPATRDSASAAVAPVAAVPAAALPVRATASATR